GEAVWEVAAAPGIAPTVEVAPAIEGRIHHADLPCRRPERAIGRSGPGASHQLPRLAGAGRQLKERRRAIGRQRRRVVLAVTASVVRAAEAQTGDLRTPRGGIEEAAGERRWRGGRGAGAAPGQWP